MYIIIVHMYKVPLFRVVKCSIHVCCNKTRKVITAIRKRTALASKKIAYTSIVTAYTGERTDQGLSMNETLASNTCSVAAEADCHDFISSSCVKTRVTWHLYCTLLISQLIWGMGGGIGLIQGMFKVWISWPFQICRPIQSVEKSTYFNSRLTNLLLSMQWISLDSLLNVYLHAVIYMYMHVSCWHKW